MKLNTLQNMAPCPPRDFCRDSVDLIRKIRRPGKRTTETYENILLVSYTGMRRTKRGKRELRPIWDLALAKQVSMQSLGIEWLFPPVPRFTTMLLSCFNGLRFDGWFFALRLLTRNTSSR